MHARGTTPNSSHRQMPMYAPMKRLEGRGLQGAHLSAAFLPILGGGGWGFARYFNHWRSKRQLTYLEVPSLIHLLEPENQG